MREWKFMVNWKNSGQEQGTVFTLTTKFIKCCTFLFEKHVGRTIACKNFIVKLGEEDAEYTSVIKMPVGQVAQSV
jgi:hypothetical protein